MKSNETRTRALVLGGGGVAGVAWELGILMGLYDTGVDVRGADIIIGTSAGSVVGAQITSGTDLESLFNAQLTPVEQTKERKVEFDPVQMMEAFSQAVAGAGPDPKAIRARIGAYASDCSDGSRSGTACHYRNPASCPHVATAASADRGCRYRDRRGIYHGSNVGCLAG